jgi:hypothetical protein
MRLAEHKGRPFASRPLPGPNPAFNSKSGYLVDERRFQFQLQQNAREDSARTVVHGDSVVVAIIEQSARPFKRFEFGAKIFGARHPSVPLRAGSYRRAVLIGDSIRHRGLCRVEQDVGFPPRLAKFKLPGPMPLKLSIALSLMNSRFVFGKHASGPTGRRMHTLCGDSVTLE